MTCARLAAAALAGPVAITPAAAGNAGRGSPALPCPAATRIERSPARFFPSTAAGLWTPVFRSNPAYGCVYLIGPGSTRPRAIWKAPGTGRLHGPVWAPDGQTFVATRRAGGRWHGFRVDRAGAVVSRFDAADVGFTADGRLMLVSGTVVAVQADGAPRTVAVLSGRLVDIAATRGYGPALAVQWWARGRPGTSRLLLVYPDGRVLRATPTYRGDEYMPGPPAWTPDGKRLAIPWQRAPRPGERGDHVHCLAMWTVARGYRASGCEFRRHFDTIVWAPDGSAAITDGGHVINPSGRIVGRVKAGRAVGVRWVTP